MSIQKYRSECGRPFARLDMETVRNPYLSNAEIGLLLRLINLPDSWKYSDVGYCCVYYEDGRSALRSQIKSLEAKGYIKRVQNSKDERGLFRGTTLIIHETLNNGP